MVTIASFCFLVWALGVVTSHPLGGFIHVFAFLAIALVAVPFLKGQDLV